MYKLKKFFCVIALFSEFFSFSITSIAFADDLPIPIDGYTQEELEEGVYTGSGGLSVYLDGVEQDNTGIATYGTVSDQSNLLSIGYDVYSTAFNFRTEEQFLPTADIGYTKSFADSVLTAALKDTQVNSLDTAEQVFKGIIGETIVLHYEDENGNSTLPENSKITLNLSFDDTTLQGGSSWRQAIYSSSSPYSFSSITSANNYVNAATSLLNINSSAKWYGFGTLPKIYLGNAINVYFVDTDGDEHILGSYTDMSAINVTFTSPADVVGVYIDVQYDMNGGVWANNAMVFPSIYKLSLSGEIAVDTSGVSTGLLKSIIEWLRNILSAIKSLPQQIANFVIEGLKSLFIPSSENIMSTFDGLKTMAENKLGFLYTIFQMVYDLFNSLVTGVVNPMQSLTIPRFSFPFQLAEGGEICLWNEMTFDILPAGMEVLHNLVKTVTSIIIVLATMSHCVEYFREFYRKE